MSSISPGSGKEQLSSPRNENAIDEETITVLKEWAPLYNAESRGALDHDLNRPDRTKEVPYEQWLVANPRLRPIVESRWNDLLQITDTNNFYLWFRDNDDLVGYKIYDPESQSSKPALKHLLRLEANDPELFAYCRETATAKLGYTQIDVNQESESRSPREQHKHSINNIVATWVCELSMQKVVARLISAGVTQEEISSLYS